MAVTGLSQLINQIVASYPPGVQKLRRAALEEIAAQPGGDSTIRRILAERGLAPQRPNEPVPGAPGVPEGPPVPPPPTPPVGPPIGPTFEQGLGGLAGAVGGLGSAAGTAASYLLPSPVANIAGRALANQAGQMGGAIFGGGAPPAAVQAPPEAPPVETPPDGAAPNLLEGAFLPPLTLQEAVARATQRLQAAIASGDPRAEMDYAATLKTVTDLFTPQGPQWRAGEQEMAQKRLDAEIAAMGRQGAGPQWRPGEQQMQQQQLALQEQAQKAQQEQALMAAYQKIMTEWIPTSGAQTKTIPMNFSDPLTIQTRPIPVPNMANVLAQMGGGR